MTDEEIIELAWQYGDTVASKGGGGVWEIPNIVVFARAIEQRTLTNQKAKWYQEGVESGLLQAEKEKIAQAQREHFMPHIRARGE